MASTATTILQVVWKSVQYHGNALRSTVNELCAGLEPCVILLMAFAAAFLVHRVLDFALGRNESLLERSKTATFRFVKSLPFVRTYVATRMAKTKLEIVAQVMKVNEGMPFLHVLPSEGWTKEAIFEETDRYAALGSCDWSKGRASGVVYNYSRELVEIATQVYGQCAWTNPLHHAVFPGVHKMEAEVVRMVCDMFHGGPKTCGVMTSGGTESILMACKAYRDRALSLGIRRPQIVAPVTAHAAFDKAAALMGMRIVHVPIDGTTMQVNVAAMRRAANKNTCMLVVSAPQFPHGIVDPVQQVAKIGLDRNIPVHVDACLGGFLLPFLEEAGFPFPLFDFRVPGVMSISCDTHKYGGAPKGTSVLIYRDETLRHFQFFVQPNWPGGIYASPSIPGSRSGGVIATCWATMLHIGRKGYVEMTQNIVNTARKIREGLDDIEHVRVLGDPRLSVVAFTSDDFNVYRLSDDLGCRGWSLNPLQFPSSIHFCVTNMHTGDNVAEQFLHDVRDCVDEIMKSPKADKGGLAAMYGMAQSVPDRSVVSEMACYFLDACYSTENLPNN